MVEKNPECFWLEHEIIAFLRLQQLHHVAAAGMSCAVINSVAKVRFPAPEVIIDINDRHARFLGAPFQTQELGRHRTRIFQQLICFGKIKIVDDIDQKEGDFCLSGALPWRSMFFSASVLPYCTVIIRLERIVGNLNTKRFFFRYCASTIELRLALVNANEGDLQNISNFRIDPSVWSPQNPRRPKLCDRPREFA